MAMHPRIKKLISELHHTFDQEGQHELLDKLEKAFTEDRKHMQEQRLRTSEQATKNKLFAELLERELKKRLYEDMQEQGPMY